LPLGLLAVVALSVISEGMTMNSDSPTLNVVDVVRDRLRKSSSVVVRTVSCDYEQGVLVLRGQVPSEYCKRLALEAIARLPGVTQVADESRWRPRLGSRQARHLAASLHRMPFEEFPHQVVGRDIVRRLAQPRQVYHVCPDWSPCVCSTAKN
jgi:hypothetical protein